MSGYALFRVATLRTMTTNEYEDISGLRQALHRDEIREQDQYQNLMLLNKTLGSF